MHEQKPDPANQVPALPDGSVSEFVRESLESQAVDSTNGPDRIRDVLVGVGLRVMGTEPGAAVLAEFESSFTGGKPGWNAFTRTEGLRRAFADTGGTEEGMQALSTLSLGLRQMSGGVAMSSMDQVNAYLGVTTEAEARLGDIERASNWKQALAEEVWLLAETPGRLSAFSNQPGLGIGTELGGARDVAIRAGVDLALLDRTAEFLRSEHERGAKVGHAIVQSAGTDYDKWYE